MPDNSAYTKTFRDRLYFSFALTGMYRFNPWRRHRVRWWGLARHNPPGINR